MPTMLRILTQASEERFYQRDKLKLRFSSKVQVQLKKNTNSRKRKDIGLDQLPSSE